MVLIGQLPVRLRQPVAGELAATVQRLERLGDRLVRVSLAWDAQLDEAGSPWDGPVSDRPNDVADRLTALEQTLRDLRLLA